MCCSGKPQAVSLENQQNVKLKNTLKTHLIAFFVLIMTNPVLIIIINKSPKSIILLQFTILLLLPTSVLMNDASEIADPGYVVGIDEYLVPISRMRDAKKLLEDWEEWYENSRERGRDEIDRIREGDPCNVPPSETLRVIYFWRFHSTLVHRAFRRYRIIRHLAEHMEFYSARLGTPPGLSLMPQFCKSPQSSPAAFPTDNGLFMWPPHPYPLMCEDKKCIPCEKVSEAELIQACDVRTPISDGRAGGLPIPEYNAQIVYQRLKAVKAFLNSDQQVSRQGQFEGEWCSADPDETLAFVHIHNMRFYGPDEVTDFETHEKALEEIKVISSNYDPFKFIVDDFRSGALGKNYKFCRVELRPKNDNNNKSPSDDQDEAANRQEWWMKGAFICSSGVSGKCMPCKESPPKGGKQLWTYEHGKLRESCSLVTQLYDGAKPIEEIDMAHCEDTCPEELVTDIDNGDACNNIIDGQGTSSQNIYPRTNADRWRQVIAKNNSSPHYWNSTLYLYLVIFGVNFRQTFSVLFA